MSFPFQQLYDFFTKSLDGRTLKGPVSDPIFMRIKVKNGIPFNAEVAPTTFVLPFLVMQDGQQNLQKVIGEVIAGQDDSFCLVLAHEGHVKLFPDEMKDDLTPMLDKGLMLDPTAQHVLLVRLFHRTGTFSGFLPIDKNRVAHYAPPTGLETEILHVKVGADQNLH